MEHSACFIDFLVSFRAEALSEPKISIEETKNTPYHARRETNLQAEKSIKIVIIQSLFH